MFKMLKNPLGILTFLTGARRRGRQVDPHDEKGGKPLAREQLKISEKLDPTFLMLRIVEMSETPKKP